MKILIAEDDPFTRQALVEIVQGEGWEAAAAPDGTRAWSLFQEGGFHLVLLDIMMPGISGYDLCRRIREKDAAVPVLFISAKSEEVDKVVGLELGADDFITKPFGVREVAARLRAAVRRLQQGPSSDDTLITTSFHFGTWTIRLEEMRAEAEGGRKVDLTARELELLKVFAAHPGKVLSRAFLFQRCWGWEKMPESRSLDQHIAVLRKKLEEEPGDPRLIRTVQGSGYRYEKSP